VDRADFRGQLTTRVRWIDWSDVQLLTRGWLPARIPTQMLFVRACESPRALRVENGQAGTPPRVENLLETDIHELLLCDSAGQLHHALRLRAGQTAALLPLVIENEKQATLLAFARRLLSEDPLSPAEQALGQRSIRYQMLDKLAAPDHAPAGAPQYAPDLESQFQRLATMAATGQLTPGSYIAIVARPAEVPAGIDGAIEKQSMHVIHGTW